jgi:hypothetical protein
MLLAVGQTFEQRQHASLIVWDRHLPLLICDDLLGYVFREYNLVTPDNAASVILTAIKVLSQEARNCTGRALAYGMSHDDFLAMSGVVSALNANRTAFGCRAPSSSFRYHPRTVTEGGKGGAGR